jgi:hypothetical protein
MPHALLIQLNYWRHSCKYSGCQAACANKFCIVAPNMHGYSVRNLLHVIPRVVHTCEVFPWFLGNLSTSYWKFEYSGEYLVLTSFISPAMQQSNYGLGRLIVEVPRSHIIRHTHTHTHIQPVRFIWTTDRLFAEASTYTTHKKHEERTLSGVRNCDTSNRAAADHHLDSHQHHPPSSLFTIQQTFDQTHAVEKVLLNKLRKMWE